MLLSLSVKMSEAEKQFMPKNPVAQVHDRQTIYVYPFDQNMLASELNYGFHITKAALEQSSILFKTKINALGNISKTTAMTGIIMQKYLNHVLASVSTVWAKFRIFALKSAPKIAENSAN